MPALETGDILYNSDEVQRWNPADFETFGLALTYGNGCLTGWTATPTNANVIISSGNGVVRGVYVTTLTETILTVEPPIADGKYWIILSRETAPTKQDIVVGTPSISLRKDSASTIIDPVWEAQLGTVIYNGGQVSSIDQTEKDMVTYASLLMRNIETTLKKHHHLRQDDNVAIGDPTYRSPIKVDLDLAELGQDEVYPELPARKEVKGKLSAEAIYSVDAGEVRNYDITTLPPLSHLGRKREVCHLLVSSCTTDDHRTYRAVEPWVTTDTSRCVVFRNGVAINPAETPYTFVLDAPVDGVVYGSVVFGTDPNTPPQPPEDSITVLNNLRDWYLLGGKWSTPDIDWSNNDYVYVYVNEIEQERTTYTPVPEKGKITFNTDLSVQSNVTVTLRGVQVSHTGHLSHSELDDRISCISDFAEYDAAYTNDANLMELMAATETAIEAGNDGHDTWHQGIAGRLPADWQRLFDDDASTIRPLGTTVKCHPSNPAGAGQAAVPLGDGTPRAQTFTATFGNVTQVSLWLSKVGSPYALNEGLTLDISVTGVDGSGLPDTSNTLMTASLTKEDLRLMAASAKRFYVEFTRTNANALLPGKHYAIVVQQSEATDDGNCFQWHCTNDGRYINGTACERPIATWSEIDEAGWVDFCFRACGVDPGETTGVCSDMDTSDYVTLDALGYYQTFRWTGTTFWKANVKLLNPDSNTGTLSAYLYDFDTNSNTLGTLIATSENTVDITTLRSGTSPDTVNDYSCFYFVETPGTDVTVPANALKLNGGVPDTLALLLKDGAGKNIRWMTINNSEYTDGQLYYADGNVAVTGYQSMFCLEGGLPKGKDPDDPPQDPSPYYYALYGTRQASQSLTVHVISNVSSIEEMYLKRVGTETGYRVRVRLHAAVDDKPSGPALCTGVIPAVSIIPTTQSMNPMPYAVYFALPPGVDIGSHYCVVLDIETKSGVVTDENNCVHWHFNKTAIPDGVGRVSTDGGLTWSAPDPDMDFTKRVFGDADVGTDPDSREVTFDIDTPDTKVYKNPIICVMVDKSTSNYNHYQDDGVSFLEGTDKYDLRFGVLNGKYHWTYDAVAGGYREVDSFDDNNIIDHIKTNYPDALVDILCFGESGMAHTLDTIEETVFLNTDSNNVLWHTGSLYSMLGGIENLGSASKDDLIAAVDAAYALKPYELDPFHPRPRPANSSETPLVDSIRVAIERLTDAQARTEYQAEGQGKRQLILILLTDGADGFYMDTTNENYDQPENLLRVTDDLAKKIRDNEVKFYGIGYGRKQFLDINNSTTGAAVAAAQDYLMSRLANAIPFIPDFDPTDDVVYDNKNAGFYFQVDDLSTHEGLGELIDVIDNIEAYTELVVVNKTSVFTKVFGELLNLSYIQLNATVPAGTTATFDMYLFSDEGYVTIDNGIVRTSGPLITQDVYGNPVSEPYVRNAPANTQVNFIPPLSVYAIGFVVHLSAGSTPELSDITIGVSDARTDYIYTLPISINRPLQEIIVPMFPNNFLPGIMVQWAVYQGDATHYPLYYTLGGETQSHVLWRNNDTLTNSGDNHHYTPTLGQWDPNWTAIVRKAGAIVAESEYTVSIDEVTLMADGIDFIVDIDADDYTLSLISPTRHLAAPNLKGVLPLRRNEAMVPDASDDSGTIYYAKYGPWSPEHMVIVKQNGGAISSYSAYPNEGKIVLNEELEGDLTISIITGDVFRIAGKVTYQAMPDNTQDFFADVDFAAYWSHASKRRADAH
jgi:hypothetical protein